MDSQPASPTNIVERPYHPISVTLTKQASQNLGYGQTELSYEAISDLLTRDSAYSAAELTRLHALAQSTAIIARLRKILNTLSSITSSYEEKLAHDTSHDDILRAIKTNDEAFMKEHGLNFKYVQFDEVLAAFLVGNPPIDIETVGPYLCALINPTTNTLEINMANIPVDEAVGIQMAAIFKKLTDSVEGKVRIVALLDEFNNYVGERSFTEEEQDSYIVAIADLFVRSGVIEPGDVAGKDFLLLRESEQLQKVDDLVERLRQSDNGSVSINEEDELVFMPSEAFIDSLVLSKNRRKELKKQGIVLRNSQGEPLCQTLDAAGFLGDENKYLMHVVMLEDHMTAQQDKVFTLLKALGITNEHRYHNVFFDAQNLPPEVIVYGITKKLQNHIEQLINRLQDQQNPQSQATA
jgi:hypothetical protein